MQINCYSTVVGYGTITIYPIVLQFNDLFVVCAEQKIRIPGITPKYKVKAMIEVEGMTVRRLG